MLVEQIFIGDDTGEGVDGDVVFASELCDAVWCFSLEGLVIDGAFCGDDKIGWSDGLFCAEGVGDAIEAGLEGGVLERHEAVADAACCAGAGVCAVIGIEVGIANIGEVGEGGIGLGELGGGEAFLGTVDVGGAIWTEEGVCDVAGYGDGRGGEGGCGIDEGDFFEVGGDGIDFVASGVEKAVAEGGGDAEAGVVGGAAADADDDLVCPFPDGGADHEADAEGGRLRDIALVGRDAPEAVCL